MVATRVRAEASAKSTRISPSPSVVSACGGHVHVTFPGITGLPLLLPPACTLLSILRSSAPARDGDGVQSSPLPTPGREGQLPLLLYPGAGRQRQSQGGLAAPAWPLPVTAPGRMRPAATTMHYPESLKCLLNDKGDTNSCANSLIKVRETLQGAAPLVPALGSPEAAGQPGLKSLWFFCNKTP